MTSERLYIAGDWGTTRLRLFLCRDEQVVDRIEGPAVAPSTADGYAAALARLTAAWSRAHGALPVWLAGMIGSRHGWREAPYVACPADAAALSASILHFVAAGQAIAIAPGLSCTNPLGAPDMLRGEETQIIGVLAQRPALARGSCLFVLPGTHSKWVLVEDGRIVRFQTSLSGELYALLREHSTLARVSHAPEQAVPEDARRRAFQQGAARARELHAVPLAQLLFETRSRQLSGDMCRTQALAYLSGLIIGQEVSGALALLDATAQRGPCVPLVGAPDLIELYGAVLATHDITTLAIDAAAATLAGLRTLAARADGPQSARVHGH